MNEPAGPSRALKIAAQRIELDGDKFVRHIDIAEGNGDDTSISLSDQTTEPATLTSDESARFE